MNEYTHESKKPLKLLYIMGTARSGSTILEIILGKGIRVFGAGELTSLIEDGLIHNKVCSCEKVAFLCPVWGEVKKDIELDYADLKKWAGIQRKIDRHGGFVRQLCLLISKREKTRYGDLSMQLFKSIEKVTGCDALVDSSKYTGRAIALSELPDVDVHVICLTRSPGGLIQSFKKKNEDEQLPKSLLSTLVYYMVTLVLMRMAIYRLTKKIHYIKYEKMISNPIRTLAAIEEFAGIDLSHSKIGLKKNMSFDVGHIITGNRLRKKRKIIFRSDSGVEPLYSTAEYSVMIIMRAWQFMLRF